MCFLGAQLVYSGDRMQMFHAKGVISRIRFIEGCVFICFHEVYERSFLVVHHHFGGFNFRVHFLCHGSILKLAVAE